MTQQEDFTHTCRPSTPGAGVSAVLAIITEKASLLREIKLCELEIWRQ